MPMTYLKFGLVSVFILAPFFSFAQSPAFTILDEDFDSFSTASLNGQGSWVAPSYNVVSAPSGRTGKAIAPVSSNVYAYKEFYIATTTLLANKYQFSGYFLVSSSTSFATELEFLTQNNEYVNFAIANYAVTTTGLSTNLNLTNFFSSSDINQWHYFSFLIDPANSTVTIQNLADRYSSIALPMSNNPNYVANNRIRVKGSAGFTGAYFDDLYVGQLASTTSGLSSSGLFYDYLPSQDDVTSEYVNFGFNFFNSFGTTYDKMGFQLQDITNSITIDTSSDSYSILSSGENTFITGTWALYENTAYMWRPYVYDSTGTSTARYGSWVTFSTNEQQFQSLAPIDNAIDNSTTSPSFLPSNFEIPNFIASSTIFSASIEQALRTNFPFSYIYDFGLILQELYPAGAATSSDVVVPITGMNASSTMVLFSVQNIGEMEVMDDVRKYTRWGLWLFFAMYVTTSLLGIKIRADAQESVNAAQGAGYYVNNRGRIKGM